MNWKLKSTSRYFWQPFKADLINYIQTCRVYDALHWLLLRHILKGLTIQMLIWWREFETICARMMKIIWRRSMYTPAILWVWLKYWFHWQCWSWSPAWEDGCGSRRSNGQRNSWGKVQTYPCGWRSSWQRCSGRQIALPCVGWRKFIVMKEGTVL